MLLPSNSVVQLMIEFMELYISETAKPGVPLIYTVDVTRIASLKFRRSALEVYVFET